MNNKSNTYFRKAIYGIITLGIVLFFISASNPHPTRPQPISKDAFWLVNAPHASLNAVIEAGANSSNNVTEGGLISSSDRAGETILDCGKADVTVPLINLKEAQAIATGKGVTIAVLDTGIDTDHPLLAGVTTHKYCVLSTCESDRTNVEDEVGHGTAVAGVIFSQPNWLRGVAPDAKVAVVKITSSGSLEDEENEVAGLDWVIDHATEYNIRLVNLSFGTIDLIFNEPCDDKYQELSNAIHQARDNGIAVFISTGNPDQVGISSPACISSAIAIGASKNDDGEYIVGRRNNLVDLVAPTDMCTTWLGGSRASVEGTSFSTPAVAGVAALMLEANPDLTVDQLESILKSTGRMRYDEMGQLWLPRVDALAAVKAACGDPLPPPAYSIFGRALDRYDKEIPGLTISIDANTTTTTGEGGRYIFDGLQEGDHEMTASARGYTFYPTTVHVPPNQAPVDIKAYLKFCPSGFSRVDAQKIGDVQANKPLEIDFMNLSQDNTVTVWVYDEANQKLQEVIDKNTQIALTYTPTQTGSLYFGIDNSNNLFETCVKVSWHTENIPPIITEGDTATVTMSENGSPIPFALTLSASDADGDTLTWSISTQAGHGTATASGTGNLISIGYTPDTDYQGTDSFVVQVDDGNGGTDAITVNVSIIPGDPTGLVAYYPFNGNANDESGNGNNGTPDRADLTKDRFGNLNSAYYFDGKDAKIRIQDSDSLDIGYDDYTIVAWIKTTSTNTSNSGRIFSKGSSYCVTGYMMRMGGPNSSRIHSENAAGGSCKILFWGDKVVNDGQWHFVVGVVDRDVKASIYIDGSLDKEQNINTSGFDLSNSYNAMIGYNNVHAMEPFDGSIDDVRIYNRALTGTEIQTLYYLTAVNNAPVITGDDPISVTMSEDGSPVPFALTLHATDADGDTLTWSISTQASHGTATASGTGNSVDVGYSPAADYYGADNFVVQVGDGNGGTDAITVNVTIASVNDAPTDISLTASSIAENQPVNSEIGSLSASDVDTDETFVFGLACASPGADDASFNINGASLRTSMVFDYETKNSYVICIRVGDQGGAGLAYDKNFTIHVTNMTPTGVAASNGAYTDKVQVTWDAAVAGTTSYRVYRATSATGAKTLLGSPATSPYNDSGATPGVTYYYWVKACNGTNCSNFSTNDTGWRKLLAPTGVTASDGTYTDKVALSWTGSAGATYYQVYRSTSATGTKAGPSTTSSTTINDTSATPGVTYWYWVKACRGSNCSDFSAYDTGWRNLAAPTNVQASDGTFTDKVQITWTASLGATSYKLYRATSAIGTKTLLGSTTGTAANDTSATSGTTYYYWVKACRGTVCSDFSAYDTGYRKASAALLIAPPGIALLIRMDIYRIGT
jgi:fibronectin type 3 domain-containing protein